MRTMTKQGLAISIVSVLLCATGSILAILNYYDQTLPITDTTNIKAIARAGLLIMSEFVFLYVDLIPAFKLSKRISKAVCLSILAACLALVVSAEFEASARARANKDGASAIASTAKTIAEASKSKRERSSLAQSSFGAIKEMYANSSENFGLYKLNFFCALLIFAWSPFMYDKAKPRVSRGGNLAMVEPDIAIKAAETVKQKIGFSGDLKDARVYAVNGGYAVRKDGKYLGFAKKDEVV